MHFNELILQYRLQLMGGTGLLGTAIIYISKEETKHNAYMRFILSLVLIMIVTAAASLDIFYYDNLLSGAVKAIIELETKYPDINLSTTIRKETSDFPIKIIYIVYLIVLIPLFINTYYAFKKWRTNN